MLPYVGEHWYDDFMTVKVRLNHSAGLVSSSLFSPQLAPPTSATSQIAENETSNKPV